MKAIRVERLGEPEVLELVEMPDPAPSTGEVLVETHAVGVNPVETYVRAGLQGYTHSVPYTPGSDGAGVVVAVGAGVTGVKEGDRVYTSGSLTGTYAQYVLCTEKHIHPLPEVASFEQGAAIGIPYATAYRALFNRAHAQPGECVLIHGASGGVGLAAVQMARAHGLTVIGTAGSEEGRDLVLQQGAHHVVDHYAEGYLGEAAALCPSGGFDIILEMLANQNLGNDLTVLAKGGRVVVIGSRGTVVIDPRDTMKRDASILGFVLFNASDAELTAIHNALVAGLESGTMRPVIGRTFPLEEAAAAHHAIMESNALGKIVLTP